MKKKTGVAIAVIVLCVVVATFFFFRRAEEILAPPAPTPVAIPPALTETMPITPMPTTTNEPAINHPLETPPPAEPLPALDQSDAQFLNSIGPALGSEWLAQLLPEEIIRRIVVTVDNLPRKQLPAKLVPLKRASGGFVVDGEGESLVIGALNSARYATYVQLFQAINPSKLVSVYAQYYPLFQSAYEDLGYPKAYFNDRLVEAIDDLLAAPEVQEPIHLVQPKVLYEFADPGLAERSAGQKILLRMGHENAGKIKAKLGEIRRLVVRPS